MRLLIEWTRAIQANYTSETVFFLFFPLALALSFSASLSLYQKADGLVGICRKIESGHSNAFTLDLTLYDDVVSWATGICSFSSTANW